MNILEKIDRYLGEEFSVYMSGGSIGDRPKKTNKKGHGLVKGGFASKEEAMAFAKKRNAGLSPGEKKHYKMKYYVESVNEAEKVETMVLRGGKGAYMADLAGKSDGDMVMIGIMNPMMPKASFRGLTAMAKNLGINIQGKGAADRQMTKKDFLMIKKTFGV